MALQRVPDANVTWTEGGMLQHKHSDVGVAVSIPGGLITPVVRNADDEAPLRDFHRDEGSRRAGAGEEAGAAGISGRRHVRSPTSACSASRILPR